ncbi:hypothetical protein ALMP_69730 [Streptomyces sp. A012304]|nr:hypothetical protein ALMP_69730 [Streptomyces sp. A012304]
MPAPVEQPGRRCCGPPLRTPNVVSRLNMRDLTGKPRAPLAHGTVRSHIPLISIKLDIGVLCRVHQRRSAIDCSPAFPARAGADPGIDEPDSTKPVSGAHPSDTSGEEIWPRNTTAGG